MEVVCGSITVRVAAGSTDVSIQVSDDTTVVVEGGEEATIAISPTGSFVVTAVAGGDGVVDLRLGDGTSFLLAAGGPPIALRDFVGFRRPVDNGDVVNTAKAGSNVPLKWRLLSESGAPIVDLAGASVSVVTVSCQTGAATDAIEELASAPSALQNLGNGEYQLNWKSDKAWSGCRRLKLTLAGEAPITHDALFKFK